MKITGTIGKRLTYANVMATAAFVLAAGTGGAYAATTINGHDIKNHTVPASKLVKGAVVPKAKTAEKVSQVLVTHAKRRHSTKHLEAVGGDGTTALPTTAMVPISLGDTVTVLQSGPFTVTAKCVDDGNGKDNLEVDGAATDGWYSNGGDHHAAGQTDELWADDSVGRPNIAELAGTNGMFTDAGDSLIFQTVADGEHVYGDCSFGAMAVTS